MDLQPVNYGMSTASRNEWINEMLREAEFLYDQTTRRYVHPSGGVIHIDEIGGKEQAWLSDVIYDIVDQSENTEQVVTHLVSMARRVCHA